MDLEALSAAWRGAFDAADAAVEAAAADNMDTDELNTYRVKLKSERATTAAVLEQVASMRGRHDAFVSLMVPRSQVKALLGLPVDAAACVFNLEGVLIGSAQAHATAWSQTFDEFLHGRIERTRGEFAPFDPRIDYVRCVEGRPRLQGVRMFLSSRGIRLPEGTPNDPPGAETVHGLANRKNSYLQRYLRDHGVTAFAGARRYLDLAHEVGVLLAVVSASANTRSILHTAGLDRLVDGIVDGRTIEREGLKTTPDPDMLLAASEGLGVAPARTVVFERNSAGVAAAHSAGYELVVGVGRGDEAAGLREANADVVVADLAELLFRQSVRRPGSAAFAANGPFGKS